MTLTREAWDAQVKEEEDRRLRILFGNAKPMTTELRELYGKTNFFCECGGDVIPQTREAGICTSCNEVRLLHTCDYETTEEDS